MTGWWCWGVRSADEQVDGHRRWVGGEERLDGGANDMEG